MQEHLNLWHPMTKHKWDAFQSESKGVQHETNAPWKAFNVQAATQIPVCSAVFENWGTDS